MKDNKITIRISKPLQEVFKFTTTPPNSTRWINDVVEEKTNEQPVKVGTIYKLKNKAGEYSVVYVIAIKVNELVEWVSKDQNYHCRYTFKPIDKNTTELEYYEWADKGNLEEPFTLKTLQKLKSLLEK